MMAFDVIVGSVMAVIGLIMMYKVLKIVRG